MIAPDDAAALLELFLLGRDRGPSDLFDHGAFLTLYDDAGDVLQCVGTHDAVRRADLARLVSNEVLARVFSCRVRRLSCPRRTVASEWRARDAHGRALGVLFPGVSCTWLPADDDDHEARLRAYFEGDFVVFDFYVLADSRAELPLSAIVTRAG